MPREVFTKLDGASFDLHESSADEMGRAMSAVMSRSNLEALQWFAVPTSQRSAESGRALVDPTHSGHPGVSAFRQRVLVDSLRTDRGGRIVSSTASKPVRNVPVDLPILVAQKSSLLSLQFFAPT